MSDPAPQLRADTGADGHAASAGADGWEYQLRGANGCTRGLFDVAALRGMLYTGQIDIKCRVRHAGTGRVWPPPRELAGADWQGLDSVPALRALMTVLDMEVSSGDGECRIAGWQKSTEDTEDEPSTPSLELADLSRSFGSKPGTDQLPVLWLVAGTVALLVIFVVIGLFLS